MPFTTPVGPKPLQNKAAVATPLLCSTELSSVRVGANYSSLSQPGILMRLQGVPQTDGSSMYCTLSAYAKGQFSTNHM